MSEEIPLCKRSTKKARLDTSDVDRISALPDDILAHILSFVGTKEAVRTCILSKRWRKEWASMPCLRFDIADFVPEGQVSTADRMVYEERFSEFIRGVLRNREGLQLDVFELEWSTMGRSKYCTSGLVEECVSHAIQSEPRVFSLHIFESYDLGLDYNEIFTCASLEEISLVTINEAEYAEFDDVVMGICDLPRLKRLKIAYKRIDNYFLETLFRGCPALEELELCECGLLVSKVHSTGLKRLVICGCLTDAKLHIDTPNLENLTIATSYIMMESISISGNFPSLVDASIDFPPANDHDDEFAILFNSLSNATSLNLSFEHLYKATSVYIQKLQTQGSVKFPSFKNLRSLVLGDLINPEIDLIALFLQHSPNLQELTLHRIEGHIEDALRECSPISKIVKLSLAGLCLNCHLSVIGSILQHLPLLEKLVLYPQSCQGLSDGQDMPLEAAPFPCEHLKAIEIAFFSFTDDLVRVLKYLHAGIKGKETKLILTNSLKLS